MVSESELLDLVKCYGTVKVSYLEDQFLWYGGEKFEVKQKIKELCERGELDVPEPGFVSRVSRGI